MGLIGGLFLIIGGIIVFLWIPLLVAGIFRLRRYGAKPAGIIMTVFGGLLGLFSLAMCALIGFVYMQFSNLQQEEVFNAAEYKGATGKVKIPFPVKTASISVSKNSVASFVAESEGDTIIMPEGDFDIYYMSCYAVTKSGKGWTLFYFPDDEKITELSVRKDEVTDLEIGSPIDLYIDYSANGNTVELSMEMKDKYGNTFSIMPDNNKPLGFQIVSENGKLLFEDKFEYG